MASAVNIGISLELRRCSVDGLTSITRQTTLDPSYAGLSGPKKAEV